MGQKHKHHDVIVAWAADQSKTVQYFEDGEWVDIVPGFASWSPNTDYRIKPEPPAKVYPKTLMTNTQINEAIVTDKTQLVSFGATEAGRRVANAALCHAIDAKQVIATEDAARDHLDIIQKMNLFREQRDMAIAIAVSNWYQVNGPALPLAGPHPNLPAIIASVKE